MTTLADHRSPPPAVHPERTADPRTARWHVAGGLPATAEDLRQDSYLAQLLSAGVLDAVTAQPDAVVTTLGAGHTWPGAGAAVREAVQHAVAAVRERSATGAERDAVLARYAEHAVGQDANPYAASHGGGIELLGVRDDVVHVRMTGACHGCPAAGWTIQGRLEGRLRAVAPWLAAVRVAERMPR